MRGCYPGLSAIDMKTLFSRGNKKKGSADEAVSPNARAAPHLGHNGTSANHFEAPAGIGGNSLSDGEGHGSRFRGKRKAGGWRTRTKHKLRNGPFGLALDSNAAPMSTNELPPHHRSDTTSVSVGSSGAQSEGSVNSVGVSARRGPTTPSPSQNYRHGFDVKAHVRPLPPSTSSSRLRSDPPPAPSDDGFLDPGLRRGTHDSGRREDLSADSSVPQDGFASLAAHGQSQSPDDEGPPQTFHDSGTIDSAERPYAYTDPMPKSLRNTENLHEDEGYTEEDEADIVGPLGRKKKNRVREAAPPSFPEKPSRNSRQRLKSTGGNLRVPKPTPLRAAQSFGQRQQAPARAKKQETNRDTIFDDPAVVESYNSIPVLEIIQLPRGGVSMETQAVGRVQFGIPPETIKDSMRLGLQVPSVFIVPVERFCREMGPALGVNLAEFEFPGYFNFFIAQKRCTLIVDSDDAERNIRRVFGETLLGPAQFRRTQDPITYEEEDFSPDFPREAIPDFYQELKHFRTMPNGKELVIETLLKFCHFEMPDESGVHENLGIPPPLPSADDDDDDEGHEEHDEAVNEETPGRPPRMKRSRSAPDLISTSEKPDGSINDANGLNPSGEQSSSNNQLENSGRMNDSQTSGPNNGSGPLGNSDSSLKESIAEIDKKDSKGWAYSRAKWIGDVATVYPENATTEQIANRSCKRVEIFKMPGGTEYILHDVDENNYIVGKARFSGNVRVSESMGIDGFGGQFNSEEGVEDSPDGPCRLPPSFHPPSFGLTVLGNSHGFDSRGSTSGYVLWINGRGVMIDPPPYSSATLEREGIRPRTIVGIILTHCHADHDAGAFQKVLTGSPVVVITTPTIYRSFIRKYAALSALSPALLRHSHRHKPAIIGSPLRFQGATFHFTYTLHSIPCIGFRVEWRGRSMVFTGDHLNSPEATEKLFEKGVLSRARADDLLNLPLQDTDLLLHESGAPPLHTQLDVLLKLPERVKKRLYVVHTSALPEGCELRVAPTGTAGTIRLDQSKAPVERKKVSAMRRSSILEGVPYEDDSFMPSMWSSSEYDSFTHEGLEAYTDKTRQVIESSIVNFPSVKKQSARALQEPPLVSLRPTSSTDAWFILNLLSAVPFLSSLSYSSTMEVLETARVDAFCSNDIVVPASRRHDVLCVVWEGTCMEREKSTQNIVTSAQKVQQRGLPDRRLSTLQLRQGSHVPLAEDETEEVGAVWHAGDWTGPRSLQPERALSGENDRSSSHDIVAVSSEGVKVITIEFASLNSILKSGSLLYKKYLTRSSSGVDSLPKSIPGARERASFADAIRNLNVIELLENNSALRKLSAVQKRHLESLAEGPEIYGPKKRLWRAGAPVEKAFIIVVGTASFVPRRRNAGSVGLKKSAKEHGRVHSGVVHDDDEYPLNSALKSLSIGETMRLDAMRAVRELGPSLRQEEQTMSETSSLSSNEGDQLERNQIQFDSVFAHRTNTQSRTFSDQDEFTRLSRRLKNRADAVSTSRAEYEDGDADGDLQAETAILERTLSERSLRVDGLRGLGETTAPLGGMPSDDSKQVRGSLLRRRSSRDRFANKVLGRLYNRRAFTSGLVFSRGHFLGDVSKMVAGLLSSNYEGDSVHYGDDSSAKYGFGESSEGYSHDVMSASAGVGDMTIHEQEGDRSIVHSSTLAAGNDGCVVLVFPKMNLIPFLDEYPGLLLSLLGTQVVV